MAAQLLVPVRAARSADDHEPGVVHPAGMQGGQRPHGDVGALQRLDAPDVEQERAAGAVEAEGALGHAAVARREESVVDAEGHDLDAVSLGVVQLHELVAPRRRRRRGGRRSSR